MAVTVAFKVKGTQITISRTYDNAEPLPETGDVVELRGLRFVVADQTWQTGTDARFDVGADTFRVVVVTPVADR